MNLYKWMLLIFLIPFLTFAGCVACSNVLLDGINHSFSVPPRGHR